MRSPKTSQDHIWHNRTPISKKVIFFTLPRQDSFITRLEYQLDCITISCILCTFFMHSLKRRNHIKTAFHSNVDLRCSLVQLGVKRVPWRSPERECKYEQGSFKPNGPHRNQCSLSAFRVDCGSTFADWACKIDCRRCVRSRTYAPYSHSEVETSKAGYTHTEYF